MILINMYFELIICLTPVSTKSAEYITAITISWFLIEVKRHLVDPMSCRGYSRKAHCVQLQISNELFQYVKHDS